MKVIEVMANSDKSWEDATRQAVKHASKSVKHIKSVFVNLKVQLLMEMMWKNSG